MTQKGYYKSDEYPPIYLIVINELPVVSEHYPLLLFAASEQKFREFLTEVIATGEYTYVRYAYEIRPQTTKEVLTMSGMASRLSRKDLEFMAEDIGPDMVAVMKSATLLKGMNAEKRQELLSEILDAANMEEVVSKMSPVHRKRLLELALKLVAADLHDDRKGSPA